MLTTSIEKVSRRSVSRLIFGLAGAAALSEPLAVMAVSPQDQTLDSKKEPATALEDMADAEVRKIDFENKKITLRHGIIKNLDMPAMSMVFHIKDVTLLEKVKAGDKVRFFAEKLDGVFVVTSMYLTN